MTDAALSAPQPLGPDHELAAFECGITALDEWLERRARRNEIDGASRTVVACSGRRVVGYYCLAATPVLHAAATGKVRRSMPGPVPALLLGRLAVDRAWQCGGLGSDLLADAVLRALAAADAIGVRAILVHAISDGRNGPTKRTGFGPPRSSR